MTVVEAIEFCERVDELLSRVRTGETIDIERDGALVARLSPVSGRRRWVPASDFLRDFSRPPRVDWETFRRDVRGDEHIDHHSR